MGPSRSSITNLQFNIDYENKESIQELLGDVGQTVLDKVLRFAEALSKKRGWPLTKVRLQRYTDYELPGREYILVIMVFDCTFDTADKYLHEFCNKLDLLSKKMSDDDQVVLRRLIFFDIATTEFLKG
ncbi:MAG: hypothetical protein EXR50_00105 [Dehalococcoidia bacterium]|nr:hypothetical protein [Dehalococcoidia bacterium]